MFFLAFILAAAAAWAANAYIQKRIAVGSAPVVTVKVAVAASPLVSGQKLQAGHTKLVDWPKELLPPDTFQDIKDIEGWVVLHNLPAGAVITKANVTQHPEDSHLSALVSENKRAMALRVDDVVGMTGLLLPGNYVDVLGIRMDRASGKALVRTVAGNVKVLAVGDDTGKVKAADGKSASSMMGMSMGARAARTVTVEVTPEESEALIEASNEGRIQLTLRNPMDQEYRKKLPKPKLESKPQPQPQPEDRVVIIRGGEISQEKPARRAP